MPRPFYVYDNWSAYDELSDNVPLTEELAMRELAEMRRLMSCGVKFDAYLMDAFWYARDGGYYTWRPDRWPNGPDRWLEEVQAAGMQPGLWFPANTIFNLEVPEAWEGSVSTDGWGLCCFEGGFLQGFLSILLHWYEKGVRVFKFDFAEFGAAPQALRRACLPSEIKARNVESYHGVLAAFRALCPEARLLAYNGFEEAEYMTWTDRPVRRVMDLLWLEVFDSIYCGDPRPADLPLPNFWRTLDVYADHMVWYLADGGIPPHRIDNCAFMIGNTGTCYRRGKASWKTTLLLSLARGGQIHMTLGNLESLTDDDARWFAEAQRFFEQAGPSQFFGETPGGGGSYGYATDMDWFVEQSPEPEGSFMCVVNASLATSEYSVEGELLYADGHYSHTIEGADGRLQLGPGGFALMGVGSLANAKLKSEDSDDPELVEIDADWTIEGRKATMTLAPLSDHDLHIFFRQFDAKGLSVRTSGGAPPDGTAMASHLLIRVSQAGKAVEVIRPDDRVIWSGLSWAHGVVKAESFEPSQPLDIEVETTDSQVQTVQPKLYRSP